MPVGDRTAERIYYDAPATLDFTATVTAIREVERVDGRQVWQMALDRTAFYPTSGGQPYDTGTLTATARSGATLDVAIRAVEEDAAGEVWHTSSKPLQEGTEVRGVVDAARRRDHMQQHSGQHLLSAVLLRDCGAATISFHLGESTSTIDLNVPALTGEQLDAAQSAANDIIRAALPIRMQTVSRDEATTMLAAGLLRKLPARDGSIRLVEIPGIDLNACGGTHVATTAAIGPLLLRDTERVRGGVRLAFVCGSRAIEAAAADFRLLAEVGQALSTAPCEIAASIARAQAESKAATKERAALLTAMAELEAQHLARTALDRVVIHTLDPRSPGRDVIYAKLLASRLLAADSAGSASHSPSSAGVRMVLIVAPEQERASVVLAATVAAGEGLVDCGSLLRASLAGFGGRGGGTREMAQGALPLAALEAWLVAIRAQLVALSS